MNKALFELFVHCLNLCFIQLSTASNHLAQEECICKLKGNRINLDFLVIKGDWSLRSTHLKY
jgi:hypothetical protein